MKIEKETKGSTDNALEHLISRGLYSYELTIDKCMKKR